MHKTIHITRFLGKSIKGTDIKPMPIWISFFHRYFFKHVFALLDTKFHAILLFRLYWKKLNMERKNHFINIISKYTNQIPIIFIKYNCLFDAENNI